MSSIGGILHLHNEPIDAVMLATFHQSLAYRGPDGEAIFHQHPVAFTHQRDATTLQEQREQPPLQRDQVLVTYAGYLSNRALLAQQLGLNDEPTISELLVRAYQRWGADCVDHLAGPFAFAIWDSAKQRLFLVRDHVGIKPLFYLHAGPYFAFSSEIKALKTLPFFQDTYDDLYIGHFLLWKRPPIEQTTYQHIRRLPGGHWLQIGREQPCIVKHYWNLHATSIPHYSNDDVYIDEFRTLLIQSVKNSLDTPHRVGSELSGGLDSSTVAAIATRQLDYPLVTLSGIMPDVPTSNEQARIQATAAYISADPRLFRVDNVNLPDMLQAGAQYFDDIYFAPNSYVSWRIGENARENGIKVVLTGHDGNTMMSDGPGYLQELALAGHWDQMDTIINEIIGRDAPNDPETMRKIYYRTYALPMLPMLARRAHLRSFWRGVSALNKTTGRGRAGLVAHSLVSGWLPPAIKQRIAQAIARRETDMSFFSDDYAATLRAQLPYTPPSAFATERDYHIFLVHQAMQSLVGELRDIYAGIFGLDYRHPFADRYLIEYAVNLPTRLKLRDGWGRWMMRAAIGDWLPDTIRWSSVHTLMSDNFSHVVTQNQAQLWEMANANPAVSRYIRLDRIKPTDGESLSPRALNLLWNAAVLSVHLK